MPKAALPPLPVSALFGVVKPSGPTSMSVVTDIQELVAQSRLFVEGSKLDKLRNELKLKSNKQVKGKKLRQLVKVGQGGTLDPLADGVLVVGVGKGTKKLSKFLDCTKEYRTTCLLGCETDTYDSEGSIVRRAPWRHVTPELVQSKLAQFTGKIQQTPPIFSALKMDGRPLYEYARQGIPLPRPIEPREVTVHFLELTRWLGTDHQFSLPKKEFSGEEKEKLAKATHEDGRIVPPEGSDASFTLDAPEVSEQPSQVSAAFILKMNVSGGTYVRSIVHDLAQTMGSSGHVVTLTRTRQGNYVQDREDAKEGDYECIRWDVFQRALEARDGDSAPTVDWDEWEEEIIKRMEVVS